MTSLKKIFYLTFPHDEKNIPPNQTCGNTVAVSSAAGLTLTFLSLQLYLSIRQIKRLSGITNGYYFRVFDTLMELT